MTRYLSVYLPAIKFLLAVAGILLFPQPVEYLKDSVGQSGLVGYITFVLLLVVATVLMPVTVMPVIPMSAAVLGPLATALLSIIGWTIGGVLAFLIARYVGRPVLEKFFNFGKIDSIADKMPSKHRFWFIVLIRLTLPVDLASYALGMTKNIGLVEYSFATLIGVSWFSFAFAYLGEALLTGNIPLLIELGTVSLLIFIVGWYFIKKVKSKNQNAK